MITHNVIRASGGKSQLRSKEAVNLFVLANCRNQRDLAEGALDAAKKAAVTYHRTVSDRRYGCDCKTCSIPFGGASGALR